MKPSYWLLKSEPETYSFANLLKDGGTNWDQVRNYQARNFLKLAQPGDLALIYHSGKEKAVVGIAEVVKGPYPDIDPDGGDWIQIDLRPQQALPTPVTLAEIKQTQSLQELPLIRHTRLSCMPVTPAQFQMLVKLGGGKKI